MSQRESVKHLGWSDDPEQTMQEIATEEEASAKRDIYEPTI